MPRKRVYQSHSVYDELLRRLEFVFDRFEDIVVSVSGGKDSTILWHAATAEAERRGRKIHLFFIDQEAEYEATIDIVREMMEHPSVIPHWYQVPIRMTNSTSYVEDFLFSWDPSASNSWMRQKEKLSIKENPFPGVDRFYDFIDVFEQSWPRGRTAFLVGIRSEESLHRYSAVTRNPGYPGIDWCTDRKGVPVFYPISHFAFEDVFIYLKKFNVKYNKIYDLQFLKGYDVKTMRVSYLMHENSYKCLADLAEFEPRTYQALVHRAPGVESAGRLIGEPMGMSSVRRPDAFSSWLDYRDFLVETVPHRMAEIFRARFARQEQHEYVYKQQCRQILIGDWENNVPIINRPPDRSALEKWRELL